MLKIESGSQINKDEFNDIKQDVRDEMLHYLKIKNKAIAFKIGFDDAVNGRTSNPEMIFGDPGFHREDTSIHIGLSEDDIKDCKTAYESGYSQNTTIGKES